VLMVLRLNILFQLEREEKLDYIKQYTVLPILLEMLQRDMDRLQGVSEGLIFGHLIYYLGEVQKLIHPELRRIKAKFQSGGNYQ
jgi:hypothetical protein